MRRRQFYRSGHEESDEIDLTPLIDVVFVVLITFILIAPLLRLDQISLPSSGSGEKMSVSPQNKSGISIRVQRDESIVLNDKPINLTDLPKTLSDLRMTFPTEVPKLFQDEKSSFGMHQSIRNALEEAGFDEMDVILKP